MAWSNLPIWHLAKGHYKIFLIHKFWFLCHEPHGMGNVMNIWIFKWRWGSDVISEWELGASYICLAVYHNMYWTTSCRIVYPRNNSMPLAMRDILEVTFAERVYWKFSACLFYEVRHKRINDLLIVNNWEEEFMSLPSQSSIAELMDTFLFLIYQDKLHPLL